MTYMLLLLAVHNHPLLVRPQIVPSNLRGKIMNHLYDLLMMNGRENKIRYFIIIGFCLTWLAKMMSNGIIRNLTTSLYFTFYDEH